MIVNKSACILKNDSCHCRQPPQCDDKDDNQVCGVGWGGCPSCCSSVVQGKLSSSSSAISLANSRSCCSLSRRSSADSRSLL
uniref:Uncharacterized protein n=1 Tax=Anguilla anguilla TaxID=7936 RepID=A0A0E9WNC7_ANGAN